MKNQFAFLFVLALAATAFSQENYAQWPFYRDITLNTTSSGANVAGAVDSIPILVRLTNASASTGSDVLTASATGADVRFGDSTGAVALPYQIERWSASNAEVWVRVPRVQGNANTKIRMFWGKSGTADSSNGSSVFKTTAGNGFQAVFHLNKASGNDTDVTGNKFVAVPIGGAIQDSANPAAGNFISGARFKDFNGTGAYKLRTATGDSTTGSLHMLGTNVFTISAWVKVTAFPASATVRQGIISKCQDCQTTGPTNVEWAMRALDATRFDVYNMTTGQAPGPVITAATPNTGVWTYVTYSRTAAASQTIRVYNSTSPNGLVNTSTSTSAPVSQNVDVVIGGFANTTAAPATGVGFFNGKIDEVTLANVARDSNWAKLSYETQKPASTAITLGTSQVAASVPGAPTGATATATNAQASVSWTAPSSNGGATITAYTVSSTPTSTGCTTTGGTTCTVTGLTNGTGYTFTVTATNIAGTGTASGPSSSVTPSAAAQAPSTPTGVTTAVSSGKVTVSWTASTANGSAITGYIVTSNPDAKTCTTTGTSCIDSTLTNGVAYTFTVVATSVAGNSAPSASTTAVTPAAVPDAPTNAAAVAGVGQAVVSWTASAGNGSAITAYTVTTVQDTTKKCTTTGAVTCTVGGLTAGSSYTFTVKATNIVGVSAASAASVSVTLPTVPGAPTITTAVGASGQVTVTWTAPTSTGGSVITAYTVTASDTSKHCTTTGALSCAVTGLTNTTAYTFTVKATNAVGSGAVSPASASVTGIAFASKDLAVRITSSSMTLHLPEFTGTAEVSIMDVWGRVVWNKRINSGIRDLSWGRGSDRSVAPGLYIVRLTTQDSNNRSRIAAESKILLTP